MVTTKTPDIQLICHKNTNEWMKELTQTSIYTDERLFLQVFLAFPTFCLPRVILDNDPISDKAPLFLIAAPANMSPHFI